MQRQDCPFCDKENLAGRITRRGELCTSFISSPWFRPGHCLVVPSRHITTIVELTDKEAASIMVELDRLARCAKESEEVFKQVISAVKPHWFMSAISISERKSYFITDIPEMKQWLSDLLNRHIYRQYRRGANKKVDPSIINSEEVDWVGYCEIDALRQKHAAGEGFVDGFFEDIELALSHRESQAPVLQVDDSFSASLAIKCSTFVAYGSP